MKDLLKLLISIIVSLVSYFPIMTIINVPFYYFSSNKTGVSSVILVLVTSILQVVVGGVVISKKEAHKSLGIGIIVGTLLMSLFMFFLTPMLGV